MAEEVSPFPTSIDPALQAAVVRLLSVRGRLGAFLVSDLVVPTVSLGSVEPLDVDVQQPAFLPANWDTEGNQTVVIATLLLADTGAKPVGTYDLIVHLGASVAAANEVLRVEHRNAANDTNLAFLDYIVPPGGQGAALHLVFAQVLAANERIRVVSVTTFAAGESANAWIMSQIR